MEAGYHVCKPGAVHCLEGISEITTNMQIMFHKDVYLNLARGSVGWGVIRTPKGCMVRVHT